MKITKQLKCYVPPVLEPVVDHLRDTHAVPFLVHDWIHAGWTLKETQLVDSFQNIREMIHSSMDGSLKAYNEH